MWVPLLNAILLAFVASGYAVSTEGGESHGSFEPTDHIKKNILPKKNDQIKFIVHLVVDNSTQHINIQFVDTLILFDS